MSKELSSSKQAAPEIEEISLADFLTDTPPNTKKLVTGAIRQNQRLLSFSINIPEISLHCDHEKCGGIRHFSCDPSNLPSISSERYPFNTFLVFTCRNCRQTRKTFAIRFAPDSDTMNATISKFGEYPEFGSPTNSKMLKIIGPDRDLFLKGRRCENQGLGVGSFGYYRRVVENQKHRILEEIKKVSEKLGVSADFLKEIEDAKKETQFTKAIESIKHGIPQALLINGHNPLTLLHSALSEGLHNQSDEECLSLASAIRIVLTELAVRLSQALKDDAELNSSVNKLLSVKSKK